MRPDQAPRELTPSVLLNKFDYCRPVLKIALDRTIAQQEYRTWDTSYDHFMWDYIGDLKTPNCPQQSREYDDRNVTYDIRRYSAFSQIGSLILVLESSQGREPSAPPLKNEDFLVVIADLNDANVKEYIPTSIGDYNHNGIPTHFTLPHLTKVHEYDSGNCSSEQERILWDSWNMSVQENNDERIKKRHELMFHKTQWLYSSPQHEDEPLYDFSLLQMAVHEYDVFMTGRRSIVEREDSSHFVAA
ncbi:MAG: hypothetical protein NVSMB46_00590 [Candidatus Saccharimonadales bacterium]